MFFGQYRYTFDDSERLTIPSRFRDVFFEGAFVTQGFDRNLIILTPGVFQEIYQLIMTLNVADPLARFLQRMILGNATELLIDEAGRVALPEHLRKFAELSGEAVLVGLGDYFEIWAPALWSQQETTLRDADANSSRFASLNLARN